MPARRNLINFQPANIQFAEFKPVQYRHQEADPQILYNSLARVEARREKAEGQYGIVNEALEKIRSQLNPAELEAFDKRKQADMDYIEDQIRVGNTSTAMLDAMRLGTEYASDTELNNKIAYEKSRKEQIAENKKLANGNAAAEAYLERKNQYAYNPNAADPTKFNLTNPLVDYISNFDLFNVIAGIAPIRTKASSSDTDIQTTLYADPKTGEIKNEPYKVIDGKVDLKEQAALFKQTYNISGGSLSRNWKSKEDMLKVLNEALRDTRFIATFKQNYEIAKDQLEYGNESQKETALRSLQDKDGNIIDDWETWVRKQAADFFGVVEFENTNTHTKTVQRSPAYGNLNIDSGDGSNKGSSGADACVREIANATGDANSGGGNIKFVDNGFGGKIPVVDNTSSDLTDATTYDDCF